MVPLTETEIRLMDEYQKTKKEYENNKSLRDSCRLAWLAILIVVIIFGLSILGFAIFTILKYHGIIQ